MSIDDRDPIPPGFTRQTVDVDGTNLSVLVGGEGAPLVLLHGWPQTSLAWRHVAPSLAEAGHTVIAPDLRGLGRSARPEKGYDKDTQADDVRGLVEALGLGPRVQIVGHDIGGMVAFAYARQHPDEVDRLVLAELAVPGFGLETAMDVARGGRWHFGFFMAPELPEMLLAGREQEFFTWWFTRLSADPSSLDVFDLPSVVASYSGTPALRAGFEHYRTLLDDGETNRAWYTAGGRLPMPTLALGGEHAVGTRLADALRDVAPGVTAGIIPRSGHFVAEENPEGFLEVITPFLTHTNGVDA